MSPQQKIVDVLRREIPYLKENYGVKKIAIELKKITGLRDMERHEIIRTMRDTP